MSDAEVVSLVDTLTDLLALFIVIEGALALLAVVYVITIYRRGDRTSRLFRMLVTDDLVKVVAGIWIGGLAVFRLTQYPIPLPIWTAPISAFAVAVLLFPPIHHAWTVYKLRSGHGDGTPPPWHPED